jgi:hypothetical protein
LFYVTLGAFLTCTCFFGAGASPNVQRKDDLWTPLFLAAMLGRTQVANMLLQVSFLQEIKTENYFNKSFLTNICYSPELTHCWRTVRDGQQRPLPESSGTSALLTSSPGQPRVLITSFQRQGQKRGHSSSEGQLPVYELQHSSSAGQPSVYELQHSSSAGQPPTYELITVHLQVSLQL